MKELVLETKNKVTKDTNITLISDIHDSKDISEKRYEKLCEDIAKANPNYIFILGDIVEDTNLDKEDLQRIRKLLTYFTSVAPVYSILGNHDQMTKVHGKWEANINKEYINMLQEIPLFSLLPKNKSLVLPENITLTGIHMPFSYYEQEQENFEFYKKFINIQALLGLFGNISNDSYRVLFQHTPTHIFNKKEYLEVLKFLRDKYNITVNFDLLLAGHKHNGMVPSWVPVPGNRGIIGLTGNKLELFQDNCRGVKQVANETTGIILPAVNTINNKVINNLYPAKVKTIKLKK